MCFGIIRRYFSINLFPSFLFLVFFLNESEVLRLDGHEHFGLQDRLAGVQRDVEAGDAGVGRRQVRISGGPDRDAWHRLEPVLGGWECGRA